MNNQNNHELKELAEHLNKWEPILLRAKANKTSWKEQAQALFQIRYGPPAKAYRARGYKTWDDYLAKVWGFSRQWAYDQIKAFQADEASTDVDRPTTPGGWRRKRKPSTPVDETPEPIKDADYELEILCKQVVLNLNERDTEEKQAAGYRKLDPILTWLKNHEMSLFRR